MAGLGAGIPNSGEMLSANMEAGISALQRFAKLCKDMGVPKVETFATAAVRNAENGPEFVRAAQQASGLRIEIIGGGEEGRYAALGVLAGIPDAEGIVGDLGGGSLELVRLEGGMPGKAVSLPIGALKLAEARKGGTDKMNRIIKKAMADIDWSGAGKDLPFYMVGGSWRALAQLQMHLSDHPLPIAHQYELSPRAVDRLARAVPSLSQKRLSNIRQVSSQRVPHLPGAALLLRRLMKQLGSSKAVASAYGIREGVFYDGLPAHVAQEDPLISATREEGRAHARFPHHAGSLLRWTDALFAEDAPVARRLRRAACELSDVAWRAHPDFRAERALDRGAARQLGQHRCCGPGAAGCGPVCAERRRRHGSGAWCVSAACPFRSARPGRPPGASRCAWASA